MKELTTIDDVLATLQDIIQETQEKNDPLGYFAVLYKRVTWKVKEGIATGYFDDAERMEKLDVIFAKRYIEAYYSYQNNEDITQSWTKAFELSRNYWPITLQHLLIGMNAHINLDLGIATAEVSNGQPIEELRTDFNKINDILSSLVNEVQTNLATIWRPLRQILLRTGQVDNLLVDFSMKVARNGAWRFAVELAAKKEEEILQCIDTRDIAVAKVGNIITNNRLSVQMLLWIIRLGETGSVAEKINKLNNENVEHPVAVAPGAV